MAGHEDELLTEVEVARKLKIERRTLQGWRQQRRVLPFVKYGRLVRYRPADLESYTRAHVIAPDESVRRVACSATQTPEQKKGGASNFS